MKQGKKSLLIIGFSLGIMFAFTGCSDGKDLCKVTELNNPYEDYIITDLDYSDEKGLQVAGFQKNNASEILASVWSYDKNCEWIKEYEKIFTCSKDKQIEALIFWSDNSGFFVPYTWKFESDPFEEKYYYVNSDGTEKRLKGKEFSCISYMNIIDDSNLFWVNYEDFFIRKWDGKQNNEPELLNLDNIKKARQISRAGNYLYVVGFDKDATIINTLTKKELMPTENLKFFCEDTYDSDGGNESIFAVYAEKTSEILFYANATGIWKYENGKKTLLLDSADAKFGTEVYFEDIAVENSKTIYISFLKIDNGIATSNIVRYEFDYSRI